MLKNKFLFIYKFLESCWSSLFKERLTIFKSSLRLICIFLLSRVATHTMKQHIAEFNKCWTSCCWVIPFSSWITVSIFEKDSDLCFGPAPVCSVEQVSKYVSICQKMPRNIFVSIYMFHERCCYTSLPIFSTSPIWIETMYLMPDRLQEVIWVPFSLPFASRFWNASLCHTQMLCRCDSRPRGW